MLTHYSKCSVLNAELSIGQTANPVKIIVEVVIYTEVLHNLRTQSFEKVEVKQADRDFH